MLWIFFKDDFRWNTAVIFTYGTNNFSQNLKSIDFLLRKFGLGESLYTISSITLLHIIAIIIGRNVDFFIEDNEYLKLGLY